jgi:hypothetical protein
MSSPATKNPPMVRTKPCHVKNLVVKNPERVGTNSSFLKSVMSSPATKNPSVVRFKPCPVKHLVVKNPKRVGTNSNFLKSVMSSPASPVNPIPERHREPLVRVEIEGQEEFEVQEVLDSKKIRGKLMYLVFWRGYPLCEATWEPAGNLVHAQDLVNRFH